MTWATEKYVIQRTILEQALRSVDEVLIGILTGTNFTTRNRGETKLLRLRMRLLRAAVCGVRGEVDVDMGRHGGVVVGKNGVVYWYISY